MGLGAGGIDARTRRTRRATQRLRGGTITIQSLQGTLSVSHVGDSKGLLALIRWHALPVVIVGLAFCAVLFDLVRRLFRNVERGESFTERNVYLVHKLGTAVIVFTLFSAAATSWCNYALLTYLEQNATVQGLKMAFALAPGLSGFTFSAVHFGVHLDVWGILTGLLILSLGEVFRQGLALEKENELTV